MIERKIFILTKTLIGKKIHALLDNVESADENDIDNLMNDSDTEFIPEEEITQDTSLTTLTFT